MESKESKNIYQRINVIKTELSQTSMKKSGHNKHFNFNYHELGDFLGTIAMLNKEHGVHEQISVTTETSTITLTNVDKPDEQVTISVPTIMADMQPRNDSIQKLGATLTYIRRYLYIQAYSIVENDLVDPQDLNGTKVTAEQKEVQSKSKADLTQLLQDLPYSKEIKNEIAKSIIKHYKAKTWTELVIDDYADALSVLDKLKQEQQLKLEDLNKGDLSV